jgi:hypothetical protein
MLTHLAYAAATQPWRPNASERQRGAAMKTLKAFVVATIFALPWTTAARADDCPASQLIVDYIKQVYGLSECNWRSNPPDGASNYYYCYRAGADNYMMIEEFDNVTEAGTSADALLFAGYGHDLYPWGGRYTCSCGGEPACYSW